MVGPKDEAQKKMTEHFGLLLCTAMRERGYVSDRSRSGVDPGPLAKRLGVTYEMARRYIEGLALPRTSKRREIERWLMLDQYTLEPATEPTPYKPRKERPVGNKFALLKGVCSDKNFGVGEKSPPPYNTVDIDLVSKCAAAVMSVIYDNNLDLDREQAAEVIARLYKDMLDAEQQGREHQLDDKSVLQTVVNVLKG